jgi:hypothetical protein
MPSQGASYRVPLRVRAIVDIRRLLVRAGLELGCVKIGTDPGVKRFAVPPTKFPTLTVTRQQACPPASPGERVLTGTIKPAR